MPKFEMYRDEKNNVLRFIIELSDSDLCSTRLDGWDRMVIDSPHESAADYLQSLEIIFRRLQEQTPAAT